MVFRQGLNYSEANETEFGRATCVHNFLQAYRWKNRTIGARAARRNAGKWVNGSGKTQKRRPGMSLKMELERQRERAEGRRKSGPRRERTETETDGQATFAILPNARAASKHKHKVGRKKEARLEKVCDGNSFALPSRMACAFYSRRCLHTKLSFSVLGWQERALSHLAITRVLHSKRLRSPLSK
jgi:hypothetical protein